jgi:hypothetical protein
MSLDLVRLHYIHTILACEHLLFFRIIEILYGTRAIGCGRELRLVVRGLQVAFRLRSGCGLWVIGCRFGARVQGVGYGLWVAGCGL